MQYLSYVAVFVLVIGITVPGCSDDLRIDGRNKDTFNTTMNAIKLTLDKEQKMRFMLAVIVLSDKVQKIKPGDPGSVMRVLLNGKTYREIIEFTTEAGSISNRALEDYYKDQLKVMDKANSNILTEELTAEGITCRFVENRHVGRLFVIQGNVRKRMKCSRKNIRVNARLYTSNHAVASEMSCAGRVLTENELVNMSYSEIMGQLNAGNGCNNKDIILTDGECLPFMIVFSDVSLTANLDEFTVDIAGSEHCSLWTELVEVIFSRVTAFRD